VRGVAVAPRREAEGEDVPPRYEEALKTAEPSAEEVKAAERIRNEHRRSEI
jgi:hypothetical protein